MSLRTWLWEHKTKIPGVGFKVKGLREEVSGELLLMPLFPPAHRKAGLRERMQVHAHTHTTDTHSGFFLVVKTEALAK